MLYYILALAALVYTIFYVVRAIYRIWFHPLSAFAGPVAATYSRSWQAGIMKGVFPEKTFADLHRQYNTQALRIGPNELHITDPALYRVIYSQTHPFPKDPEFYSNFVAIPHTLPSELDPEAHRFKRRLVNPLFSKTGVEKMAPAFQAKIEHMSQKLERLASEGVGPVHVSDMFRCLMIDIIAEFAFGFSLNQLDEKPRDFRTGYLDAFDEALKTFRVIQFSPLFRFIAAKIPLKAVGFFDKTMRKASELEDTAINSVARWKRETVSGERNADEKPVIFDFLAGKIADEDLPKESLVLLVAGGDTTAFALACGMHYILSNKEIEQKLVDALDAKTDELGRWPTLNELEKVGYLDAIVKETLRLAMPAVGQLPRVVPSSPVPALVVDGKPVPAGTVVAMSAYTMHLDTSIWGEDAAVFNPERWMKASKDEHSHLESHLVTFSKGARQCVARYMATAEMAMTLAWLFSIWKMELRTTELKIRDCFNSQIEPPGVLVDFQRRRKD